MLESNRFVATIQHRAARIAQFQAEPIETGFAPPVALPGSDRKA